MQSRDWLFLAVMGVGLWLSFGGKLPDVTPTPAPFPSDGLRVLILEETADRGKLPRSQLEILSSTTLVKWLNQHCVKDGWRKLDDDTTAEELKLAAPVWQKAFEQTKADAKGTTPWIAVTDGRSGESVPLPKTEAELMTLLAKYGGA